MTDIVERLRKAAGDFNACVYPDGSLDECGFRDVGYQYGSLHSEAADCIERLRAQVAEGRELLVEIREDRYWGRDVKDIEKMDAYLAKTK